jgi:hypothetical protein
MLPMSRDQLYPALAGGKVDMVAAMVTVRPELEKLAAFSEPTRTNVSQVVVTGPGAPPIATVDDLAGQAVFVRKGSAYAESLDRLNEQLKARGKPAVVIDEAPGALEDDDVLEMVNAGLAPITVVDDYLAFRPGVGHQGAQASRTQAAAWPSRFARRIPGSGRSSTPGSGSTARATAFETSSSVAISRARSTSGTLRPMPSAGN